MEKDNAPTFVPPVMVRDVPVAAPKVNDPSDVPPFTVSPVVVALAMFAPTPKVVEVAEIEKRVEVPAWPLTLKSGR